MSALNTVVIAGPMAISAVFLRLLLIMARA
jgi:hypothetical protein